MNFFYRIISHAPKPLAFLVFISFYLHLSCKSERKKEGGAPAVTHVKKIATGQDHTCYILNQNEVICWGSNAYGQLGIEEPLGKFVSVSFPEIDPGNSFISLAAGNHHTCALKSTGEIYCWGRNHRQQIGINSEIETHKVPQQVLSVETFKSICAHEDHSCALSVQGRVYCWGANDYLQSNLGANTTLPKPQILTELEDYSISNISCGYHHTCALDNLGRLFCWGSDSRGQLGNGDEQTERGFSSVESSHISESISSISAGINHNCLLTSQKKAYCWGNNEQGALGVGEDVRFVSQPKSVNTVDLFTNIASGGIFSCAISEQSELQCWGVNSFGQLASADPSSALSPRKYEKSLPLDTMDSHSNHVCASSFDDQVLCWGSNAKGQLGQGGDILYNHVPSSVLFE